MTKEQAERAKRHIDNGIAQGFIEGQQAAETSQERNADWEFWNEVNEIVTKALNAAVNE